MKKEDSETAEGLNEIEQGPGRSEKSEPARKWTQGTVETIVLVRCRQCGERISSLADRCPHCGARVARRSPVVMAAGVILVIFGILLFARLGHFLEKPSSGLEKPAPQPSPLVAQTRQPSKDQDEVLESHYRRLVALYDSQQYTEASLELVFFKDQGKLNYKDVAAIDKKLEISKLEKEAKEIPASRIEDNLTAYKRLLSLDPKNPRYKRKVTYYSKKARNAAKARARRAKERERAKKRIALFGPAPKPNPKDGSIPCVKDYLKSKTPYPNDLEFERWSKVYPSSQGWLVQCDYWGRNAFGGYVRQIHWFVIRHGKVVEVKEADAFGKKG